MYSKASPPSKKLPNRQWGLSLVELVSALAIATLIMAALGNVISQALETERVVRANNDIHQQARFAMQQMVTSIQKTKRLMLPLAENPVTAYSESIRDVLAVTLDPTLDRDKDGWADANNDKDYLDLNNNGSRQTGEPERIDEDLPNDISNDGAAGIIGIDDDGDGSVDEIVVSNADDDEDGADDDDRHNGLDDDGDGSIDEDTQQDMNFDGAPGVLGIDDDGNGNIDEGQNQDDDEDGTNNEDWYDPVVFFLSGTTLMQRIPNINPVDGTDYTEYPIADNVSQFRVERIPQSSGRAVLVELSLTLTTADDESAELNTQVRVGGSL